ncbi:unnamed protein product, partial [Mesorhabditis belari]|uniref:BTB domain-containing protein n=1 Tax=Mesorhabditis belari TaxID=2138241 RepID=A0AAF3F284_9BILA
MGKSKTRAANENFCQENEEQMESQAVVVHAMNQPESSSPHSQSSTSSSQAELAEEALCLSCGDNLQSITADKRKQSRSMVVPISGTLSRPLNKRFSISSTKADKPIPKTVRERIASTFLKEEWADVHFVFHTQQGIERVPSNSYILSVSSCVFCAQFSGNFKIENEIELENVDCEAFKIMLRYLYTDELHLTLDSGLNVLYLARRYLIEPLIDATLDFLSTQLTASNVCLFLPQKNLFDEEFLMKRCWMVVDAQAEIVLKSDAFKELPLDMVRSIVSRDELNVSEQTVFEALVEWARVECDRQDLTPTNECIRSILGDLFYEIRFSTMRLEAFADGPADTDFLTAEEKSNIFLNLTAKKKPTLRFKSNCRSGLPQLWRYRGLCDAIQFSVDQRIFLTGVGLYGSTGQGNYDYAVQMEVKQVGVSTPLTEIQTQFNCDGISRVFPVLFKESVQIEADIPYTIIVTIDGKRLSFFGQEGMPEVQVSISNSSTITFSFEASPESKNGTGIQGGQIPELLFYA